MATIKKNFLKIDFLTKDEFNKGQAFYLSVDYTTPIHINDTVLTALYDSKIIGIVRLSYENDVSVLRGMMIAPSFQRSGIGSLMLKHLEHIMEQRCFCLPHAWLEGFYGQIGFQKISEDTIPEFLLQRLVENRKKYPHLIVMERIKGPGNP